MTEIKKIILIISLIFVQILFGQENSIIGTWNTVSVSNDMFQMNEKKEFSLTEKGKIIHNSKNEILNLKLGYSENQFVFTENNDFYVKLSGESKYYVFKGKYGIDEKNKIINVNLRNSAGTEMKKHFKYSFENNLLKLDTYFGGEPTQYLLKRK